VTEANGYGTYAPDNGACSAAVNYPWPWGADFGSPDTLDSEWGHGDTLVVCCD
jgi:hypothetical protein